MESVAVGIIDSPSGSYSNDAWQLMLNHLGDDINGERLKLHLTMFGDLCRSAKPKPIKIGSMNDIIQCLKVNEAWMNMLPELTCFLHLFLTIPVTSCTAERSFSALRRLKTFLRSTVTQKRLNHVSSWTIRTDWLEVHLQQLHWAKPSQTCSLCTIRMIDWTDALTNLLVDNSQLD